MQEIKKIDRLDAHDRYQELSKHGLNIAECCQNLIDQRPFGDHAFYVFAHMRTAEDGVNKRLIWQPRLTKPKAQSNSMLFKVYPGTDMVKIIWMIPAREMWEQYSRGLLTENKIVSESIYDFQFNRNKLEQKEDDDMSDEDVEKTYRNISLQARRKQAHEESIRRANAIEEPKTPFKMV